MHSLRTGLAQFIGEERAGAVQTRGDRAGRAAERGGGLFVAQFLEIAEGDDFAIVGGQGENRVAHQLDGFGAGGIFRLRGGRKGGGRGAIFICGGGDLVLFSAGREGDVGALAFEALQDLIARNAEKECAERSPGGIELGGLADESHKNFLRCVLGEGAAAAHMQSEAEQRTLPAAENESEGFFVARAEAAHQAVIGELWWHLHIRRTEWLVVIYSRKWEGEFH